MTKRIFLFIHQNFPGQFVHVAAALSRQGHQVIALGIKGKAIPGVRFLRYTPEPPVTQTSVLALRDFETKVVRGLACATAMQQLKSEGVTPDVIVAHPGWGEALFCKDVWPQSRLVLFAEFFYSSTGADYNFDPEFARDDFQGRANLRLKNSVHLHALQIADDIYCPTEWQRAQLPEPYRRNAHVIFDGIQTEWVKPDPKAQVRLQRQALSLGIQDEVITFVNRNLEPYRGFHIFMRALPEILRARPNARVLMIGRDQVSYGAKPPQGGTWKQLMLKEVGAQLPMDRIHFLGHLAYADYLRVLQVSGCHVYMTYPFVLSWSCLEAMSAGCAMVASRTGPVSEVVEHGRNGLLFDFFEPQALAKAAIEVLQSPAQFGPMRQAARQAVVDRYDLQRICLPALLTLLLK